MILSLDVVVALYLNYDFSAVVKALDTRRKRGICYNPCVPERQRSAVPLDVPGVVVAEIILDCDLAVVVRRGVHRVFHRAGHIYFANQYVSSTACDGYFAGIGRCARSGGYGRRAAVVRGYHAVCIHRGDNRVAACPCDGRPLRGHRGIEGPCLALIKG